MWWFRTKYDEAGVVWRFEALRELERTRRQIDQQLDWWNAQGRTPETQPLFLARLARKLASVKAQVQALEGEQVG